MTRRVELTAVLSTSEGEKLAAELRAQYATYEGVHALTIRYFDDEEDGE